MHNTDKLTSPLKLIDLQLIKSSFSFNPPNQQEVSLNKIDLFEKYQIDIDYSIKERNENLILIFLKVGVNHNQKNTEMGYSIFAEMVNVFSTEQLKSEFNADEVKKIVIFSGL